MDKQIKPIASESMNYDTAKLRQFVQEYFSSEELRTLLFDYFRPVHDNLTDGMTKNRYILLLLVYCHNHGKMPDLLAAIQRERPFFQPDDYVQGQKAPTAVPPTPTPITRNPRQIFISHAHQDAEVAQRLAHDLAAHGYDIWIAPDSIRPGEKWAEAIDRGLEESGIFVVLLSPDAVASDWVKRETYAAVEFEDEGELQLYPLMLKKCRLPASWRSFQQISLRVGYERGLTALLSAFAPQVRQQPVKNTSETSKASLWPNLEKRENTAENQASITQKTRMTPPGLFKPKSETEKNETATQPPVDRERRTPVGLIKSDKKASRGAKNLDKWVHPKTGKEMLRVPAGEFLYGDDRKKMYLDEFWIAKTPVTNAEYALFVAEMNVEPPKHWNGSSPSTELADHPVVYVTWHDAKAYAEWAGLELPTEEQWEKGARGTDGRAYPWGEKWHDSYCNTYGSGIYATSSVREFSPRGNSYYGCVDMSGNVWEWTRSYFYEGKDIFVVRGGSWTDNRTTVLTTKRSYRESDISKVNIGFRILISQHP